MTALKKLKIESGKLKAGFTLIELLIVIAILGVLAVVILVAINPQEQLARTRDAGRQSTVTQLGHALQAYGTSHDGSYVGESDTWIDDVVTAGEIATVPGAQNYAIDDYGTGCTNYDQDSELSWCYDGDGNNPPTDAIIYAQLESGSNNSRCSGTTPAYAVFDTVLGRGGIVCGDGSEPTYNATGQSFIN